MFRICLTLAAQTDVLGAYDWYETLMPGLGTDFENELAAAIDRIAANPLIAATLYRDVRRILLHRFPYGLFFRVESETIVIIACMHHSRNPKRWEKRA